MSGMFSFEPPSPYRKMMLFIDGENIVCRYKSMLNNGKAPKSDISYREDVYVWKTFPSFPDIRSHEIIRAYYYTSVTGDENLISSIVESLKNLHVLAPSRQIRQMTTLYPVVFKKHKNSKSPKAKGVDIQMTVDILTHVYQNNVDTIGLFSGDGDYEPIIHEVIRRGKQVYIAAFSDGLNPSLKRLADKFVDLDKVFFD